MTSTPMIPALQPQDLPELLGGPLSAEQVAAATAPLAPQLIVAGAGTGKTTVMAARVVWLVVTGQVSADQVLGLTFTNKAAAELRQRIRTALSGSTPPTKAARRSDRADVSRVRGSPDHQFGATARARG
jgi:DNA helicase-2/ATP-dependent DNA helicase PcrA